MSDTPSAVSIQVAANPTDLHKLFSAFKARESALKSILGADLVPTFNALSKAVYESEAVAQVATELLVNTTQISEVKQEAKPAVITAPTTTE